MNGFKPTGPMPENINRSDEHPLFSFTSLLFQAGLILVSCFLVLYLIGFLIAKTVSMENEYEYLNSFFSDEKKEDKGKYYDLTNELWQRMTKNQTIVFNPEVMSGSPNAFILPGGQIYLTEEFLEQTESENELSFVLCHELGHFYHRHTINGLAHQIVTGIFSLMLGGGDSAAGFTGLTQVFVQSKFSREQETKADEFALQCMNKRYGHVNGNSEFFNKIKKYESALQSKYFSSHPATDDRIKDLNEFILSNNYINEGELTPFAHKDKSPAEN